MEYVTFFFQFLDTAMQNFFFLFFWQILNNYGHLYNRTAEPGENLKYNFLPESKDHEYTCMRTWLSIQLNKMFLARYAWSINAVESPRHEEDKTCK